MLTSRRSSSGRARAQVTDTPGLLARPDAERNAMERLTLATLEHLPTAAVIVLDATERCGTSVADQWAIRCELRARFPDAPALDVLAKADALQAAFAEADHAAAVRGAAGARAGSEAAVDGCATASAAAASPQTAAELVRDAAVASRHLLVHACCPLGACCTAMKGRQEHHAARHRESIVLLPSRCGVSERPRPTCAGACRLV